MTPDAGADIERLRQSGSIPGCSIALVDSDGIRWSQGFGLADLRLRTPATPTTVYHLFSGTKLFTALAVLQLAEQERLGLRESVTRYLPEYSVLEEVRIEHLLSHRSGLRDTMRGFLSVYFPSQSPPSTSEALAAYRLRLSQPPGHRVEYRNVNYALLGEVVTRVAGIEYRDYMRRNVLAPLGMNVDFDLTAEMRPEAATGYIARLDPMRLVLRLLVPAVSRDLYGARVGRLIELNEYGLTSSAIGGLLGNVEEFARFLRAQLSGGSVVLSRESTQAMQTMVAEGAPGIESRDGVGLGWKFGSSPSGRFMNHEGGGAGFTSELRLYPDVGIGIALAMNAMRMPHTMRTAHAMCEALASAAKQAT